MSVRGPAQPSYRPQLNLKNLGIVSKQNMDRLPDGAGGVGLRDVRQSDTAIKGDQRSEESVSSSRASSTGSKSSVPSHISSYSSTVRSYAESKEVVRGHEKFKLQQLDSPAGAEDLQALKRVKANMAANSDVGGTIAGLKADLGIVDHGKLESAASGIRSLLESAQNDLVLAKATLSSAKQSAQQTSGQLDSAKAELSQVSADIGRGNVLQGELKGLQDRIHKLEKKIDTEKKNPTKRGEVQKLTDQLQRMRAQKAEMAKGLDGMPELKARQNQLSRDVARLTRELEGVKASDKGPPTGRVAVTAAKAEVERLDARVADLNSQLMELVATQSNPHASIDFKAVVVVDSSVSSGPLPVGTEMRVDGQPATINKDGLPQGVKDNHFNSTGVEKRIMWQAVTMDHVVDQVKYEPALASVITIKDQAQIADIQSLANTLIGSAREGMISESDQAKMIDVAKVAMMLINSGNLDKASTLLNARPTDPNLGTKSLGEIISSHQEPKTKLQQARTQLFITTLQMGAALNDLAKASSDSDQAKSLLDATKKAAQICDDVFVHTGKVAVAAYHGSDTMPGIKDSGNQDLIKVFLRNKKTGETPTGTPVSTRRGHAESVGDESTRMGQHEEPTVSKTGVSHGAATLIPAEFVSSFVSGVLDAASIKAAEAVDSPPPPPVSNTGVSHGAAKLIPEGVDSPPPPPEAKLTEEIPVKLAFPPPQPGPTDEVVTRELPRPQAVQPNTVVIHGAATLIPAGFASSFVSGALGEASKKVAEAVDSPPPPPEAKLTEIPEKLAFQPPRSVLDVPDQVVQVQAVVSESTVEIPTFSTQAAIGMAADVRQIIDSKGEDPSASRPITSGALGQKMDQLLATMEHQLVGDPTLKEPGNEARLAENTSKFEELRQFVDGFKGHTAGELLPQNITLAAGDARGFLLAVNELVNTNVRGVTTNDNIVWEPGLTLKPEVGSITLRPAGDTSDTRVGMIYQHLENVGAKETGPVDSVATVAKVAKGGVDLVSFGTKSAVQMGVEVRTVLDSNGAIGGAAMNDAFLGKMKNIMEVVSNAATDNPEIGTLRNAMQSALDACGGAIGKSDAMGAATHAKAFLLGVNQLMDTTFQGVDTNIGTRPTAQEIQGGNPNLENLTPHTSAKDEKVGMLYQVLMNQDPKPAEAAPTSAISLPDHQLKDLSSQRMPRQEYLPEFTQKLVLNSMRNIADSACISVDGDIRQASQMLRQTLSSIQTNIFSELQIQPQASPEESLKQLSKEVFSRVRDDVQQRAASAPLSPNQELAMQKLMSACDTQISQSVSSVIDNSQSGIEVEDEKKSKLQSGSSKLQGESKLEEKPVEVQ